MRVSLVAAEPIARPPDPVPPEWAEEGRVF
jgi:hypothetical protein